MLSISIAKQRKAPNRTPSTFVIVIWGFQPRLVFALKAILQKLEVHPFV